jgi:hypothetical protein
LLREEDGFEKDDSEEKDEEEENKFDVEDRVDEDENNLTIANSKRTVFPLPVGASTTTLLSVSNNELNISF